jgi:hypothetical protein
MLPKTIWNTIINPDLAIHQIQCIYVGIRRQTQQDRYAHGRLLQTLTVIYFLTQVATKAKYVPCIPTKTRSEEDVLPDTIEMLW